MRSTTACLGRGGALALLLALSCLPLARAARAVEALDGRMEIHGFGEMQLRAIARNFSYSDDLDLTQWYWVFNAEIELDLLPDPLGPIDAASAFARIEARYDCVWTRGCGTMRHADTFGDRAERLPERLGDAQRLGFFGQSFTGDRRRMVSIPIEEILFDSQFEEDRPLSLSGGDPPIDAARDTGGIWDVNGFFNLFGSPGLDGIVGTADDPAPSVFKPVLEHRFAMRETRGPTNGNFIQTLGPWRPDDEIDPIGTLRFRPNPFNAADPNPDVLTFPNGTVGVGSAELPFRAAPLFPASGDAPRGQAQGVYYPNAFLRREIKRGRLTPFDQNFRQAELEWNRGASQQDEKELKELYVDVELFDARLFVRLGKQNIVWGKTELFRTTDQLNPQDLALASLPSLEESRIALWAARFVYSFWNLGPFEDVRVELAFNFDQFEPADLGRCGEPYTPNPVCDKTFGLFAHGLTGFALAGERRPESPWNSFRGWEGGVRLEWRWDRYSFALTDFYGFNDTPFIERLYVYERNVDPRTGRPRRAGARAGCDPDGLVDGDTSGCLGVTPFSFGRLPSGELDINPAHREAVLRDHPGNVQSFALICASSVGFSALDRSACGQTVFNSRAPASPATGPLTIASALSVLIGGEGALFQDGATVLSLLAGISNSASEQLLVPLNRDPNDGFGPIIPPLSGASLSARLTDEQEALLGCGRFYGTNCDLDGFDLLNTEASVLMQSFPGAEGAPLFGFRTDTGAQPGTRGFPAGPVATRLDRSGRLVVLPGARSPFASPGSPGAGYDPNVDGCVGPPGTAPGGVDAGCAAGANLLQHPVIRLESGGAQTQIFNSEMAALSWNVLVALIVLSGDPTDPQLSSWDGELLPSQGGNPSAVTRGPGIRCSLLTPQFCNNVRALYQVSGVQRNDRRAAGDGRFGRRDFLWLAGADAIVQYQKRNVTGFSMDFAEDRTATNWSLEATWIEGLPVADNDERDAVRDVNEYNLTVSVDRPTWIRFLNDSRTFFLNTQWFFQYLSNFRKSMPGNGPFNVLTTVTIESGYFQDRLIPRVTFVYDFGSNSGAGLPQIEYRYTANFRVAFGFGLFWGRWQEQKAQLSPFSLPQRVGRAAYSEFVENGLAPVRDRDEVFLRLRYTF